MLWATAQAEGYPSAAWATYRQWAKLGAQVRKGERSSPVVFWKINDKDDQDGAEDGAADDRRSRVFARGYSVQRSPGGRVCVPGRRGEGKDSAGSGGIGQSRGGWLGPRHRLRIVM